MEKDNVFTYEPKMKANLELIMNIMRCDCQEIVYKDKQFADLEAKLAESEKSACKNIVELTKIATEKDRKIEELKQQLAEKEKKLVFPNKCQIDELKQIINAEPCVVVGLDTSEVKLLSPIQDKILFCIEKLEEVKSFSISSENNGWCETHKDWLDIVEFIDNQIKQLKEMK